MRASDRNQALAQNASLVAAYWSSRDRVAGRQPTHGRKAMPAVPPIRVLDAFGPYLDGDARVYLDRLAADYLDGKTHGEEMGRIPASGQSLCPRRCGAQENWPRLHKAIASRCRRTPTSSTHGGITTRARSPTRWRRGRRGHQRRGRSPDDLRELPRKRSPRSSRSRKRPADAAARAPKDANAHYLYAYALGRYSQGISITKALAQGFGGKIRMRSHRAQARAQARRCAGRIGPIRPRSSTRSAASSPTYGAKRIRRSSTTRRR